MTTLPIGKGEPIEFQWFKDAAPVTTGAATVTITTHDGVDLFYLQADRASLSTTAHAFDLVHIGDGVWALDPVLSTLDILKDRHYTAIGRHSDPGLGPRALEFTIGATGDGDDAAAPGDIEFIKPRPI